MQPNSQVFFNSDKNCVSKTLGNLHIKHIIEHEILLKDLNSSATKA